MYKKIVLISKRNKVYRIIENMDSYIIKIFADDQSMKNELRMLDILKKDGCLVPKVIKISDNSVHLEDLGDVTLLDWFEMEEKMNSIDYLEMINKLADWLQNFYAASFREFGINYVLRDVNFRNFILKNGNIYGIDFEQSAEGDIVEDLGKLAAFALMYSPEKTPWKLRFVDALTEIFSVRFSIKPEDILTEMNYEINRMEIRRRK